MVSYLLFSRKKFCGYARVDVDVNYTRDSVPEEDAPSHNEGLLHFIWC